MSFFFVGLCILNHFYSLHRNRNMEHSFYTRGNNDGEALHDKGTSSKSTSSPTLQNKAVYNEETSSHPSTIQNQNIGGIYVLKLKV